MGEVERPMKRVVDHRKELTLSTRQSRDLDAFAAAHYAPVPKTLVAMEAYIIQNANN